MINNIWKKKSSLGLFVRQYLTTVNVVVVVPIKVVKWADAINEKNLPLPNPTQHTCMGLRNIYVQLKLDSWRTLGWLIMKRGMAAW